MWPFYLPRVIEMEDSDEPTSNETGHLVSSLVFNKHQWVYIREKTGKEIQ